MIPTTILKRISNGLARLRKSESGAVAVTYALAGSMLVGFAFASIDLARIASARSTLQDALDAATLGVGQARSPNNREANGKGRRFMAASLSGNTSFINLTSFFAVTNNDVVGTATAYVRPTIMGLVTNGNIKIDVRSEVVRGQDQIVELALVLDTTGSMEGSKIETLKVASTRLVTSIFAASDPGTVKVAVVPFAQHVNMGIDSRREPWAIVPDDGRNWVPNIQTPSCSYWDCKGSKTVKCLIDDYKNTTCNGKRDGIPYTYPCTIKTGSHWGQCTQGTNCQEKMHNPCPPPEDKGYWNEEKFYGCYGSPRYPDNVSDNNWNRKYHGLMNVQCSAESIRLTSNKASILDTIDAFTASGETYIPAGLAWGFNMLTRNQPITDAMAYDTQGPNMKPRKILVLMTDGANTKQMDHNDPRGPHTIDASPATEANQYTTELCNNIKAKGIEVYTVAFAISNNPGSKRLVKNCATDKDHYFDANNQTALLDAFEQIALSIQNLRITH